MEPSTALGYRIFLEFHKSKKSGFPGFKPTVLWRMTDILAGIQWQSRYQVGNNSYLAKVFARLLEDFNSTYTE